MLDFFFMLVFRGSYSVLCWNTLTAKGTTYVRIADDDMVTVLNMPASMTDCEILEGELSHFSVRPLR